MTVRVRALGLRLGPIPFEWSTAGTRRLRSPRWAPRRTSFLVAFLPYWLGFLAADTAPIIGNVLMSRPRVGAMLLRREEYMHGHRHFVRAELDKPSPTSRVVELLGHRWPRVLAFGVAAGTSAPPRPDLT